MLAQPAQSLTDLGLGVVVLLLAVRLRRTPAVPRYWAAPFWWTGIAALAGAVHHAVAVRYPPVAKVSWSAISVLVVVAVSYLLAATVQDVLGPGRARVFWLLRSVGLIAYLGAAVSGHAGVTALLSCESLTMLSVLGLWILAARRDHPRARPVLAAVVVSGAAAAVKVIPAGLTGRVGLDPTSAYHLAQIAGMALLFRAVRHPAGDRTTEARVPAVVPADHRFPRHGFTDTSSNPQGRWTVESFRPPRGGSDRCQDGR